MIETRIKNSGSDVLTCDRCGSKTRRACPMPCLNDILADDKRGFFDVRPSLNDTP